MSTADWISSILGAIGAASGAIGFVLARRAGRASAEAVAAANMALSRSAAAGEEAASALKRANEIAEAAAPAKGVRWTLRYLSADAWEAVNEGNGRARQASVVVIGEGKPARDVGPGESLQFVQSKMLGTDPFVNLFWLDETGIEHTDTRPYPPFESGYVRK